jgi:hypothetical protein
METKKEKQVSQGSMREMLLNMVTKAYRYKVLAKAYSDKYKEDYGLGEWLRMQKELGAAWEIISPEVSVKQNSFAGQVLDALNTCRNSVRKSGNYHSIFETNFGIGRV